MVRDVHQNPLFIVTPAPASLPLLSCSTYGTVVLYVRSRRLGKDLGSFVHAVDDYYRTVHRAVQIDKMILGANMLAFHQQHFRRNKPREKQSYTEMKTYSYV